MSAGADGGSAAGSAAGDASSPPALYYLRTFHLVATERSFTRAGQRLHLSQPTVSAHIRALERHYRAPLFETRNRRVRLTDEGAALLPYAERIVNLLREADHAVEATVALEHGRLHVAASQTIGAYVLPRFLRRFAAARPGVLVEVTIAASPEVAAAVLADRVPVGLVEAPVAHPQLDVRPFGADEMVLVVRPDDPWARAGAVVPAELGGRSLVRREAGSGTQRLVDDALASVGATPPAATALGSNEALREAVIAGLGVAWVPRAAAARDLAAGTLRTVKVEGLRIQRTLSVLTARGRQLSRAARALADALVADTSGDDPARPG